jgi:hypothetical protein
MNMFEWLLLAHYCGDYLLQTETQAGRKMFGRFFNKALMGHCAVYTACFLPVFYAFSLNPLWFFVIFGSHAFIDRRWPVVWWRKYVNRNSDESITKAQWLVIATDQIFHAVILVLISVM